MPKRAQALGWGGSQGEELGPLAWQRPPVELVQGVVHRAEVLPLPALVRA